MIKHAVKMIKIGVFALATLAASSVYAIEEVELGAGASSPTRSVTVLTVGNLKGKLGGTEVRVLDAGGLLLGEGKLGSKFSVKPGAPAKLVLVGVGKGDADVELTLGADMRAASEIELDSKSSTTPQLGAGSADADRVAPIEEYDASDFVLYDGADAD